MRVYKGLVGPSQFAAIRRWEYLYDSAFESIEQFQIESCLAFCMESFENSLRERDNRLASWGRSGTRAETKWKRVSPGQTIYERPMFLWWWLTKHKSNGPGRCYKHMLVTQLFAIKPLHPLDHLCRSLFPPISPIHAERLAWLFYYENVHGLCVYLVTRYLCWHFLSAFYLLDRNISFVLAPWLQTIE